MESSKDSSQKFSKDDPSKLANMFRQMSSMMSNIAEEMKESVPSPFPNSLTPPQQFYEISADPKSFDIRVENDDSDSLPDEKPILIDFTSETNR